MTKIIRLYTDAGFDLGIEFSAPPSAQLMQNRLLVLKLEDYGGGTIVSRFVEVRTISNVSQSAVILFAEV